MSISAASRDTTKIVFSKDTILKNDVEIPEGSSLVINMGVTVRLDGYRTILVRGLIIAEGTELLPIVFTSVDSGRGTSQQPSWNGIDIRGKSAQGRFRHCRIEGAFRNMVWESMPLFDSCKFYGNHYGIYAAKKAVPQIQNCQFRLNTYAIASDFASPIIAGNIITNNVIGIFLQMSSNAFIGKNILSENQTDIKSEEALGTNKSLMSTQVLWEVMRQCF
jgi:parallel beta-helix repeat protein